MGIDLVLEPSGDSRNCNVFGTYVLVLFFIPQGLLLCCKQANGHFFCWWEAIVGLPYGFKR